MDSARLISRRKYLEKWEDKQLTLLEKEIRDEEYLFEGTLSSSRCSSKCAYEETVRGCGLMPHVVFLVGRRGDDSSGEGGARDEEEDPRHGQGQGAVRQ